jgi:hypothetical protein
LLGLRVLFLSCCDKPFPLQTPPLPPHLRTVPVETKGWGGCGITPFNKYRWCDGYGIIYHVAGSATHGIRRRGPIVDESIIEPRARTDPSFVERVDRNVPCETRPVFPSPAEPRSGWTSLRPNSSGPTLLPRAVSRSSVPLLAFSPRISLVFNWFHFDSAQSAISDTVRSTVH